MKRFFYIVSILFTLFGLAIPSASARAHSLVAQGGRIAALQYLGTTTLAGVAGGPQSGNRRPYGSRSPGHQPARTARVSPRKPLTGIVPPYTTIASSNPGWRGFNAITELEQLNAGYGSYRNSQAPTTPPDQGLCVGNGVVLETVNVALAAYTTAGKRLSPVTPLNQFLSLPPQRNASNGVWGDFLSDPRCYFDMSTSRWFLTVLQLSADPQTGAPDGRSSSVILAVSQTRIPVAGWTVFRLDTTDRLGTGCPCFGDQPLLGADASGIYITANETSILDNNAPFNGSEIFAISKQGLLREATPQTRAGALPLVLAFSPQQDSQGNAYITLQPTTVPGTQFAGGEGGTEYLISGVDFTGTLPVHQIAVWALTDTSSLNGTGAGLQLKKSLLQSERYLNPAPADQKDGPRPLTTHAGGCDAAQTCGAPVAKLDNNGNLMQQAVYAHGLIWSALTTGVSDSKGVERNAIAYFVVSPGAATFAPSIVTQGYLAMDGQNLLLPAIGVNDAGQGVMAVDLMGPGYYPSPAYATLDAVHGAGPIHTPVVGHAPADDDSDYPGSFGPGWPGYGRWGDYSAAVAAADGSIWTAQEYIPDLPREPHANWGTFIANIKTGH